MVPVPNSTWAQPEPELERSPCLVGIVPIVYYSLLLGLGLPGEGAEGAGKKSSQHWGPHLLPPRLRADPSARCAARPRGRCRRRGDRWYLHCLGWHTEEINQPSKSPQHWDIYSSPQLEPGHPQGVGTAGEGAVSPQVSPPLISPLPLSLQ